MTIRRDDPVRAAFAGCSSGNIPGLYYGTKGHALCAFDAALTDFGYHLDHVDNAAWSNDAVISYYRMPSGRYEFIGYIT